MLKFITDGMLGSLTRWLRMLGCDVKYDNYTSDDFLLKVAQEEDRVLLTRDLKLFRRANNYNIKTLFVVGESKAERLANIAQCLNITLDINMAISRCPICGSSLRNADREEVLNKVKLGTLKYYKDFWICKKCGKVYWKGSHWKKINEVLNKAKMLTENNVE